MFINLLLILLLLCIMWPLAICCALATKNNLITRTVLYGSFILLFGCVIHQITCFFI